MRTLAIPILGLFLLFGCGGGEQEAPETPTETPTETSTETESLESSLPTVSQELSLPTDPDAEPSGAEDFGDIAGDADLSVSDRSRINSIGGDSDRVDYYRFSLTESKRVQLRLRTIHENETSTDLVLEDADGNVLDSITETQGIVVLEEILEAGTYYVRIEDESQDVSTYVFVYYVSDPEVPILIDIPVLDSDGVREGANGLGDITETDEDISILDRYHLSLIGGDSDRVDYYRFRLMEEREVELRLRTVHENETSTDLILEDADGNVLDSITETQGIVVLEEILEAGTYYVRIEDESQDVSLYLFVYHASVPDP